MHETATRFWTRLRFFGARRCLIVVALGAACAHSAAPTTPETDAIPPPLPGLVDGAAHIVSNPSDREGYSTGEKIIVVVETEEPVSVARSPGLRIEIGDHVRLADFRPAAEDDWLPHQPSRSWRFEYTVAGDDLDLDGISISKRTLATDPFLVDARLVWVTLTAVVSRDPSGDRLQVEPGQNLFSHRITRPREPRACADERELAMNFSAFAREWDGAPFRVDIVRNFPDSVTEADVQGLFDPLALLAQRIETRLGYSIIEKGGVIAVPAGTSPDWDMVDPAAWWTCPLSRDRGQILLYHRNVPVPREWWPPRLEAVPRCGAIAVYLPRLLDSKDKDALIVHELFHVLGFWDGFNDFHDPLRGGVPMSEALQYGLRPGVESVLWPDLDALRCIFPEGG